MADSQPQAPAIEEEGSDSEADNPQQNPPHTDGTTADPTKEKKKRKKKKSKQTQPSTTAASSGESSTTAAAKPAAKMSDQSLNTLLDMNPALKGELANMQPEKARQLLKNMDLAQLLSGTSLNNSSSQKDMASYKFWATQPVPRLDETKEQRMALPDGPIKEVDPDKIPREPPPLPANYEWVELDLTNETELKEVYELLNGHYVEDDKAMFRFAYSKSFLDWALKAPGWRKSWHVGVRAKTAKRTLVASIFGIPTEIRVRDQSIQVVEINYLCIHKKLRSQRLAPVMIKEVTRKCNLEGIYQAIYTGGVVLPTPVSTCRYFHRPIQWLKLYEVEFCQLPPYATKDRMIKKNALPDKTSTPNWRPMRVDDIDGALHLLDRYLKRFQLAQNFTRAEVEHWFINKQKTPGDRVVWAFVVENSAGHITDFTSFYNLESTVIGENAAQHDKVRAAYMYYYATEAAFAAHEKGLKERLQLLIGDLLVEAKHAGFDVFNALTLLDNPLVLDDLGFSAGDGQLHYYLYNWRTAPISGGVNSKNMPDKNMRGGMGMVML